MPPTPHRVDEPSERESAITPSGGAKTPCPEGDGAFAPDPKYTFIFRDPSTPLPTCPICTTSTMTLRAVPHNSQDQERAYLLPCGHTFGTQCLDTWLNDGNDSCPICRFELSYPLCFHLVHPHLLTTTNILLKLIPRTIPAGGSVADQCPGCRQARDVQLTLELAKPLQERYLQLKQEFEVSKTEKCRKEMEEAKAKLERALDAMYDLRKREEMQW